MMATVAAAVAAVAAAIVLAAAAVVEAIERLLNSFTSSATFKHVTYRHALNLNGSANDGERR